MISRPLLFPVLMLSLCGGPLTGVAGIVFPNDSSVLELQRDFGTVGDGVVNDTVALQQAFDASSGIGGPSRVLFIPQGVYLVTNTIVVRDSHGLWVSANRVTV